MQTNDFYKNDNILNDIKLKVVHYLDLIDCNNSDKIDISNEFVAYDFNEHCTIDKRGVRFVLINDRIIGVMNYECIDDEIVSNFFELGENTLNEYLASNKAVCVGYYAGAFCVFSDTKLIYNSTDIESDYNTVFEFISDTMLINVCSGYSFEYTKTEARATILYNKKLNVTHVSNVGNYCWAAAVAMKVNYQKSLNLRAYSIYRAMRDKYNDTPKGTPTWYKRAYNYYGVQPIYYDRGLGASAVTNAISKNTPIQISLSREGGSHAVVICGAIIYSSYAEYVIDDPNIKSKVYQYVSSKAMSDPTKFYYVGQKTYDTWIRSYV